MFKKKTKKIEQEVPQDSRQSILSGNDAWTCNSYKNY